MEFKTEVELAHLEFKKKLQSLSEEKIKINTNLLKLVRPATKSFEIEKISDKYWITGLLGQGGNGFVLSGITKSTHQPVALKVSDLSIWRLNDGTFNPTYTREVELLMRLNHDNVIKMYDWYLPSNSVENHGFIAIETFDNEWGEMNEIAFGAIKRKSPTDLSQLLETVCPEGRMPMVYAQRLFCQLADALLYLKQQNIVHHDIKPKNLIVNRNLDLKVIDLGNFDKIPTEESEFFKTRCGTILISAPEDCNGTPHDGTASDVWFV
ncbi:hypothetical protein HK098_004805 [Nowakowskiella sp. JEL0407]|nr:hypothetical protein HK098_004805 [Nowakowskiella sp. JEL0407]